MTAIQKVREALEAAQKRAEALHDVLFEAREAIRVTLKPDTPAEIRAIFDKLHSAIYILRGDPLQMHMAAILAALDAETEVKVRALEWRDSGSVPDGPWSETRLRQARGHHGLGRYAGSYTVQEMEAGGKWGWWNTWTSDREPEGVEETIEDAKAAAQADFERRIRSALVPPESRS